MEHTLLDEVVRTIVHNERLHRSLIDEHIHPNGKSRTEHMTLMHLSHTARCPSQRELSEHLHITPAAVTGILKKLERDGLITRTTGQDTRFHEIALTDRGREVVLRSREIFREIDRSMLEGFSDEELMSYLAFLRKIQGNMERTIQKSKEDSQ